MQFSINIHDRDNPNAATIFEHAEAKTLGLNWNGSNSKLERIIGSDLSFTMEVTNFQDAYFSHLYTQDERKFNVQLINEDNSSLLWEGHLLPDQYEEPYDSGAFFVNFVATCGLGSLKGQTLPEDFYSEEKTLIEVVAKCLSLTGVMLDIFVTPAITNIINPAWHQNYVDTSKWLEKDKRVDAYDILDSIMRDTLCNVKQADGAWYIYGYNKQTVYNVTYNKYAIDATHLGVVSVVKNVEYPVFFARPTISVNAPRKEVNAFYDIEAGQIGEEVYKVKNDGYTLFNESENAINPNWTYTNVGFTAKYNTKDGRTYLAPFGVLDTAINVTMRKEVLFLKGVKIQWEINLSSSYAGNETFIRDVEQLIIDGDWDRLVAYDIYYTNPVDNTEVVLFSNLNGPNANDIRYQLKFDKDRKATLSVETITPETAYYNIRFYRPDGSPNIVKTDTIYIDKLQVEALAGEDVQIYKDVIKPTYTLIEDLELGLHDDMRNLPNLIRLSPLGAVGELYDSRVIGNVSVVEYEGSHYLKLPFNTVQELFANKDNIFYNNKKVFILGKVYNFLDTDEFLLWYDDVTLGEVIPAGSSIRLDYRKYAAIPTSVDKWSQWADDIYRVGYKRYGQVVAEVLRNLYFRAHPVLRATCRGFISPRQFVAFQYDGEKIFYPLNISWELDDSQSTMVLSQNFYGEAVTENLPPDVDAGLDIYLQPNQTTASLLATATDPDGTIVTVLWERLEGSSGAVIVSPGTLATDLTGLTGDSYEFRVTVTDNNGLTASDTVRVTRVVEYTLVLTYTVNSDTDGQYEAQQTKYVDFELSPPLTGNQVARYTIDAIINKETPRNMAGASPTAVFAVERSKKPPGETAGVQVASYFETGSYRISFLQRPLESHLMRMNARAFNSARYGIYPEYAEKVFSEVQADIMVQIITGAPGEVINVPVQVRVEARK